ncbi:hypothetical protein AB3S75_006367 [Citrus x aurantiifolia]
MEYIKAMNHHQSILSKFSHKSFFIKMATKFLLPVSIFSIVVSYSSLISAALKLFSGYSIDKNYMFLLCNGILVFIVKNSGVINKSPEEKEADLVNAKHAIKEKQSEQQVVKLSEEKVDMEVEEAQPEKGSCAVVADEIVVPVAQVDGDEEEAQEQECEILITDEDREGGIGLLTTEELNKKCDEFIRKMKEGIKFEAQQLIMV